MHCNCLWNKFIFPKCSHWCAAQTVTTSEFIELDCSGMKNCALWNTMSVVLYNSAMDTRQIHITSCRKIYIHFIKFGYKHWKDVLFIMFLVANFLHSLEELCILVERKTDDTGSPANNKRNIALNAALHMLILPKFVGSENGDPEMHLSCRYSRQRNIKENKTKSLTDILQDWIPHHSFYIFTSYVTLFAAITKLYILFKF